ncbi:aldo/keto reductase [Lapidilactobacillus gannanensis]|uniref:Aldo/keto reductase n=1 Tax=Lapidilactobacillus gannanensis TaxID=2486002 RepID=A0ABW4BRC4_9LACO|nr:aldo/keto reductase [Lapidilactobacillus gannanensis]
MQTYMLRDGLKLPQIGFGTYQLNGNVGANAIVAALNNGYRLLDTAYNYENEGTVGAALRRSGVPRDQVLITSKLPGRYYQTQAAIETIQESLYRTGLDYFDLYLLHWPNPRRDQYVMAWEALIEAKKFGLVRSIGVCNFLPEHLERLAKETSESPVINQIELHPYFNQQAQREYHQAHQILTEAWSPLGRASVMLQDPLLQQLAAKYHKNVGQLILRWELQLGILPIPKSATPSRQKGNLDVFDFEISPTDMTAIASLTRADGRTTQQDPAVYEEF